MKRSRFFIFSIFLMIAAFVLINFKIVQATPANYKQSDFTKEELDMSGLNEKQISRVLEFINHYECTCGCKGHTWAGCIKTDLTCTYSRPMGENIVKLVKEDKSAEFMLGYVYRFTETVNLRKIKAREMGVFSEKLHPKTLDRHSRRKVQEPDDLNKVYAFLEFNAPVFGPKDAPVTLIEYSDYQCPFCKKAQPVIKALQKEYTDKIRIVIMNYPLPNHSNALPAAIAARAAGRQGKFWEMHDLLFENNNTLEDSKLVEFAKTLNLNIEKFNVDRMDQKLIDEVLKEKNQAISNNIRSVPSFFINGKKLVGDRSLAGFKRAIERALDEAKGIIAKTETLDSKSIEDFKNAIGQAFEEAVKKNQPQDSRMVGIRN